MAGLDAMASPRVGRDGRLYVFTDLDAPRGRICVADPAAPGPDGWRDLVGEDPSAVLRELRDPRRRRAGRPVLVVSRTRHAVSEVSVHDLATGELVSALELPGIGTVGGIAERPEGGHEAWFGYTDYTTAPMVLRYDAATGRGRHLGEHRRRHGRRPPPAVTASQVTYHSADGTPVRMVIIEPAGDSTAPVPGERSCILYGYGGFDISLTPGYSASILAWVEAGGVYAVAGLRGGSEEGEEWHRAGMLGRKQNVFDDFHAAAEYLIAEGITDAVPARGVGRVERRAARRRRGHAAAGAVRRRGVLGAAARHGAVRALQDRRDVERGVRVGGQAGGTGLAARLLALPPGAGRRGYPAVLFTVFTNDTRVDPLHGYKMCAALQHATASARPVLLRAEGEVGHSQRAVSLSAALSGDCLAFVAHGDRGYGARGRVICPCA